MDYRIFNVHTWLFLCVRVHTGGLCTPTASQHNVFDSEKLSHIFLVLLTQAGFEPPIFWIFGYHRIRRSIVFSVHLCWANNYYYNYPWTHSSQSLQIHSKHRRAESFETCCKCVLLLVQITRLELLFTCTVQKYILSFCNYIWMQILFLKMQVNGPLPKHYKQIHRELCHRWFMVKCFFNKERKKRKKERFFLNKLIN